MITARIVCNVIELKNNEPKWRQIAAILADRIYEDVYPPGSKVPTVLEIVAEFKVANRTAQKAVAALREDKLVRTEYGMGSFVVDQLPDKPKAPDQ